VVSDDLGNRHLQFASDFGHILTVAFPYCAFGIGMGSLRLQEIVHFDIRLPEDGAQRALRHIAGMMWQRYLVSTDVVSPHLVTSGAGSIEDIAEAPELAGDFAVLET